MRLLQVELCSLMNYPKVPQNQFCATHFFVEHFLVESSPHPNRLALSSVCCQSHHQQMRLYHKRILIIRVRHPG
jgi:hypothetical protein